MKYKGIISLKGKGHCVQNCCNLLQVSPAGFYGWVNYKESHRKKRDNELKLMITNCFYKSKSSYAYPRITKKLEANGEMVGKNRVANLMKEQGLVATHKKAFRPKTTLNNPEHRKSDRVFKVENPLVSRPNKVWFSDLTYLPLEKKEFVYLVAIMDLFDRRIVGWDIVSMNAENTDRALLRAVKATSGSLQGLAFHSEQGSQYSSDSVRERLSLLGIIQSMSRRGNCYDNAFMESFFHTLKNELPQKEFKNLEEARETLFLTSTRHSAINE